MVKNILNALIQNADKINAMVLLPSCFENIIGTDAQFETATSSQIKTLMLFYRHKVITTSIGLVLYHNDPYKEEEKDRLQNEYDVVAPCAKMLKKALKLDRVHIFGDISLSQLLEKMDFCTELGLANDYLKIQGLERRILISIISLSEEGQFVESDKEHKKKYEKQEHVKRQNEFSMFRSNKEEVIKEFPVDIDSTTVFKNFSTIRWYKEKDAKPSPADAWRNNFRVPESKYFSMVELATRITNITNAIMLLFQYIYYGTYWEFKRKEYFQDNRCKLSERPGIQNITYIAKHDNENLLKLTGSMCARALQEKEAKVNIVLDFLLNLSTLTVLYAGHQPTGAMIDSRTKAQFDKIKANKDNKTLKLDIFNTLPLVQM